MSTDEPKKPFDLKNLVRREKTPKKKPKMVDQPALVAMTARAVDGMTGIYRDEADDHIILIAYDDLAQDRLNDYMTSEHGLKAEPRSKLNPRSFENEHNVRTLVYPATAHEKIASIPGILFVDDDNINMPEVSSKLRRYLGENALAMRRGKSGAGQSFP